MLNRLNLTVRRGASAQIPIRLETPEKVFVPITTMLRTAPMQIIAPGHGLLNGWRVGVMNAAGLTELNSSWDHLDNSRMYPVEVLGEDRISLPDVNACGFRPYLSGGQLVYYAPLDLSTFSAARMDVKRSVGGTRLASFSTAAGTMQLNAVDQVLWVLLTPADTIALPHGDSVFDIELVRASGDVVAMCSAASSLTVLPEVTTST
jgi:hypothetical protein